MWIELVTVFVSVYFLAKFILEKFSLIKGNKNLTDRNEIQNKRKEIPGMKPTDPVEGNYPEIKKEKFVAIFLRKLHETYGPVASFWEGKKMCVSVGDPDKFKQLKHLYAGPDNTFDEFKLVTGPEALLFCDIEEVRRRRKFYEQHFMTQACLTYSKIFSQIALEYKKRWDDLAEDEQLPLVTVTSQASLEAMSRTTYGDIFDDEEKMKHFHELNEYVFQHLMPTPPIDSEEYKKILENVKELKSTVKEVLKERKNKKTDDERLFIDVMIEEEFTDEQRLADAFLMIIAGYQTSSTHIAWTLYHLAQYQEIQDKLHDHIVSTLGDGPITYEEIPKLTYLKQVLDEGLRFFTMLFFSVRKTHKDIILDDYVIPKNTNVYNATGMIHSDSKYFPNPLKFNPDNFSPENIRARHAFAFKPFGYAGKRQCLGQTFAITEASFFIAEWCRHFRFRLAPGQRTDVGFTPTILPEEEIWVTLEKRLKPKTKIQKNAFVVSL